MRVGWKSILVAVVGITVIAMGCGSDDDSNSAAGSAEGGLSKAVFVKQASKVCQGERENSFEQVAAYTKKYRSEGLSGPALTTKAVRAVLLSIIAAELDALRELEAPSEDEQRVDAILTAEEAALEEAKQNKKKLEDVEDYFAKADKELEAYGLGNCTKGTGD